MVTFQNAYKGLIKRIEKKYEIKLVLSEKVSLKKFLGYSQSSFYGRTLEQEFGATQQLEAHLMWLGQYGFSPTDTDGFYGDEKLKQYFRKVREDCLLL